LALAALLLAIVSLALLAQTTLAAPDVIVEIVYDRAPWQVAWGHPIPDPSQRHIYVKHTTWPGWARMSPAPSQTTDAVAVAEHSDGRLYVVWTAQATLDSPGQPHYGSVAPENSLTIESGWVTLWSYDLRQPWLYHDASNALLVATKKGGTNTRYRWAWTGTRWDDDNAFQERHIWLPMLAR